MNAIRTLLALLLIGSACGCSLWRAKPLAPAQVVAPTASATGEQIAGLERRNAELEAQLVQERDLAQRAAGSVYGAAAANQHNAAGVARDLTGAQAAEAATALPPATEAQKLAKDAQNARALAGQLADVVAEMQTAGAENKRLRDELAAARLREADALRQLAEQKSAGERERAEASAKLQAAFDGMNARIKAAEDAAKNQAMLEQVATLNEWGAYLTGAAVLVSGLAGMFGGLSALRVVGPLAALAGLGGMACFGLAQIVGQAWFKWAILGGVLVAFGLVGWWVWKKYQAGTLAEKVKQKADKLSGTLKEIVPVLDDAYEGAEASVKELLNRTIFQRLKDAMTDEQKAVVKAARSGDPTDS